MRRAVYFFLIVGVLAEVAGTDEPLVYRGQTAAQWLQQLSHSGPSARAAAAQAFVIIGKGNEAAVDPLIGLLSDPDAQVRFYAAYALGKLDVRPNECIAALTKALTDKDEHVRYTTQWSLAQIAQRIAESNDGNTIADDSLATLLTEAETQLLVAGVLPGHLKQVRAAIARFDTPAPQHDTVKPSIVDSGDQNDEINRCLETLTADDITTKVKALESLRKLGAAGVQRLLDSPDTVAELDTDFGIGTVREHLPGVIASLGEPVVPVLMQALRHPRDEISSLAASSLVKLGPVASGVLPELTELLASGDSTEVVRLRAIEIMKSMGPVASGVLPELIELIESGDSTEEVRLRAIEIMKSMGPAAEGATDLLARMLNDVERDDLIQTSAAEALGAIGPSARRAVPALIGRLAKNDDSDYVRPVVAAALVRIDPKSEEVTLALIAAFEKSEDIFAAIGFAEKLCECGPGASKIVPRLIEAIDETSLDERAATLRILGELGGAQADEVSPLLFERLIDPDEELMVRVAAAKALGKLGPDALRPVIRELQHDDAANRLIAARALVEIGSAASPAMDALHNRLIDGSAENELRALAAVALGQIGPEAKDAAPALTELLRDPESDNYLRSMCAVALGQVDPTAVPVLESMLDDAEAEVQIASAYSLCKMNPQHARGLASLLRWLESDECRDSAIHALVDIGETALAPAIETMNDRSKSRDTRVACLEVVSAFDERAIEPLLHALNDQDIAEEAGWALPRRNGLLPTLIASMDDDAKFTPQARAIIGNVIEDLFTGLGGGDADTTWVGGHALTRRPAAYAFEMSASEADMIGAPMAEEPAGGASDGSSMPSQPITSPAKAGGAETEIQLVESPPVAIGYKSVDVFYGTNRQPIDQASGGTAGSARWFWPAAFGLLSVVVIVLVVMYRRGARRKATAGLAGTTLILLLGLFLFAPAAMRQAFDKSGPRYGGDYTDRVEMGVCEVTIPTTHRPGELEAPTVRHIQVEDLQKHIVLKSVQRMESAEFFTGLQKELQSKGNNVLVFIHGYNVSFEDAARRTAQMSADLKFAGAPVFYSWPSQADWWKYRKDEKNVELSVDQLKSFLLAIAQHSKADTINLVAHSMGNRALTDALKEMDEAATAQQQLFNQVILAAPDIDADIFKQRIAPAIVTKAKHFTLYASSNDLALVASRTFNSGDPRAGDAGKNLVVVPGIETIDVSSGDSSLLGHSYYGDNVSVLHDIEYLLRDEPASSRRFLELVSLHGDLSYWLFQPQRISQRIDSRYLPR